MSGKRAKKIRRQAREEIQVRTDVDAVRRRRRYRHLKREWTRGKTT